MANLSRTEIALLTPPERMGLIGDLWDSLTEAETPPTLAQRHEIERRLETFEQDRADAVDWKELKKELGSRTTR